MSQNTRHEVLQNMQHHYLRASNQAAKGVILDSGQQLLGVGRKYQQALNIGSPVGSNTTAPSKPA